VLRVLDHDGHQLWPRLDPDIEAGGPLPDMATSLAVSADGAFAVVGRHDGSVARWDLRRKARDEHRQVHEERVRGIAIAADGSHVASVTSSGHLVIWKAGVERPLLDCQLDGESLESVEFFGDAVVTTGWRDSGLLRWWWWDPDVLAKKIEQVRSARAGR
jgi:WD40 repeat protein